MRLVHSEHSPIPNYTRLCTLMQFYIFIYMFFALKSFYFNLYIHIQPRKCSEIRLEFFLLLKSAILTGVCIQYPLYFSLVLTFLAIYHHINFSQLA